MVRILVRHGAQEGKTLLRRFYECSSLILAAERMRPSYCSFVFALRSRWHCFVGTASLFLLKTLGVLVGEVESYSRE